MDELSVLAYRKKLLSKLVKNKIDPHSLPPSNAPKCHTLRVYPTVQEWRGHNLDPKKYGFFDFDAKLKPITYTEPLAPGNLFKIILCNWSKSACQSGKCSSKSFSYTVMNCVVAEIIVLTYVRSTMRLTLTLKKTAIKLTLLSMTLIWTYWLCVHCCFILLTLFWLLLLNHIMLIVVVHIFSIVLTLIVEWKRYPKLGNNMATIMFFTQKNAFRPIRYFSFNLTF